jgi:hypothetical protein
MYRSLTNPFTREPDVSRILRETDGATIPADPLNIDWQAYQAWLKAGNAPADADISTGSTTHSTTIS